jgi:hypothetical protein
MRRSWLAMSGCVVALVSFSAQAMPAEAGPAPSPGPVASGRTIVDGDSFVEVLDGGGATGDGVDTTPLVASAAGQGFAVSDFVQRYAYRAYTISLVDSPGITQMRSDLVAAAAVISAETGLQVSVAPGVVAEHTAVAGEILVRTAETSSCGALSVPGVAGCGGARTSSGSIVSGNVSLATVIPCTSNGVSIVSHELGHAFGLGHYSDSVDGLLQLMYPSTASGAPSFRAGDKAGLRAIAGQSPALAPAAASHLSSPDAHPLLPTDASGSDVSAFDVTGFDVTGFDVTGFDAAGPAPAAGASLTASAAPPVWFSQPPVQRVLDTRNAIGSTGPFASGEQRTITLPASLGADIGAVVLNVTVSGATARGYVTVWPTGQAQPATSNANYAPRRDVANLVIVQVGAGGKLDLSNFGGPVDLIADVFGVFTTSGTGGFVPTSPTRLLDSRSSTIPGERGFPLGCGDSRPVGTGSLSGAGVPSNATAEIVNLTAADTAGAGFFSLTSNVIPKGTLPATSNSNLGDRDTRANLAITPGRSWYVRSSDTMRADAIADVTGYFVPKSSPPPSVTATAAFVPVSPTRVLDTRNGIGLSGPFAVAQTRSLPITVPSDIVATHVVAVVINLTATDATATSYLTAVQRGQPTPNVSNLNFAPGSAVPNLAVVQIDPASPAIDLFAAAGSPQVLGDIMGYFVTP